MKAILETPSSDLREFRRQECAQYGTFRGYTDYLSAKEEVRHMGPPQLLVPMLLVNLYQCQNCRETYNTKATTDAARMIFATA